MSDAKLREDICRFARSLYDRGLTHGSTGNISARCPDGGILVTPTGSSFGFLDPATLSKIDGDGRHVSGDRPTKEVPLHTALYDTRGTRAGAVVHLHSHFAVAFSLLPGVDPENALPPLTAYSLMQLGKVRLLPYMRPGDPAIGDAIRGLDGKHSAVLLANHGPVVATEHLASAVWAMEELEATARLALEMQGREPALLNDAQIAQLADAFGLER